MLTGIILIGGNSKRMGQPKALLEFRGMTLLERTAQLLSCCCSAVYISGKPDQSSWIKELPYPFIADNYPEIGPMAGILSAFEAEALDNHALFVLATDMPLVESGILNLLIAHRDPQKHATLFIHRETGFLEPLCAIYEPSAYHELKKAFAGKEYSLQRIFDRSQLSLVTVQTHRLLININTPEELEQLNRLDMEN